MNNRYVVVAVGLLALWPMATCASDYSDSVTASANRSLNRTTAGLLSEKARIDFENNFKENMPSPPPVSEDAANTIRPALATIASTLPPEKSTAAGKPAWTIVSDAAAQQRQVTAVEQESAASTVNKAAEFNKHQAERARSMAVAAPAPAPVPDPPVVAPQPVPAPVVMPLPAVTVNTAPAAEQPLWQQLLTPIMPIVSIIITALIGLYVPRAIKAFETKTGIELTDQQRTAVYNSINTAKGQLETLIDRGAVKVQDVSETNPEVRKLAQQAINRVPDSSSKEGVTIGAAAEMIVGRTDTSPKPSRVLIGQAAPAVVAPQPVAEPPPQPQPEVPQQPPPMTPQQAKAAYMEQMGTRVPLPPQTPPEPPSAPSAPPSGATLYSPPPATPTAT